MNTTYQKRKAQLGMPQGTACHRLRKMIMFDMAQRLDLTTCFKCKTLIENVDEFTIEHKQDWMNNDPALFWDIDNIAFSHAKCNRPRPYQVPSGTHGIRATYEKHGCRCKKCRAWKSAKNKRTRQNKIL